MSDLDRALVLATYAHSGQKRKVTNQPYIFHSIRVMLNAAKFGQEYAIVAVLHDTVEDTDVTIAQLISEGFSPDVVEAVEYLTKVDYRPYNEYLLRVKSNPLARIVKILDIEDNMSDLHTLAVFDVEGAERLRKKYETALAVLRE